MRDTNRLLLIAINQVVKEHMDFENDISRESLLKLLDVRHELQHLLKGEQK